MSYRAICIPLSLYPDWMHRLLFVQPFAGVVDIPFRIYSGNLHGQAAWAGIGLQIGWTLVLVAGRARVDGARRCSRLEVQGG